MGEIIRQTINLYNTVGLVDKDKYIYFVPHKADLYGKVTASRTKVCDCYHELFNQVSPFSSKYQNVDIDQWNPEDRELVIDGLIDDFRQSRGQGLALNYLIVTRAIYEVEGETETLVSNYYQAFFIDSVEQSGSRSVRLNLSNDYFTNLFYLNNNDTCTATYDPFNPIMKNCFVERQHYDRFEKITGTNNYKYKNLERLLFSEESFKFKYQYKNKYEHLPVEKMNITSNFFTIIENLKQVSTNAQFLTFLDSLSSVNLRLIGSLFISYLNIIFKENLLFPIAMKLASDSESTVFRRGYISNAGKYGEVYSPLNHCVIPFISIPNDLSNIKPEWIKMVLSVKYGNHTSTELGAFGFDSPTDALDYLTNIGGSSYILTAFVSKCSPLSNNAEYLYVTTSSGTSIKVNFEIDLEQSNQVSKTSSEYLYKDLINLSHNSIGILPSCDNNKEIYLGSRDLTNYNGGAITNGWLFNVSDSYLVTENSDVQFRTLISGGTTPTGNVTFSNYKKYLVFVLGDSEMSQITLNISDGLGNTNVKNTYIDPVLESDPYTIISLSLNETEQLISKTRLIESYNNSSFEVKLNPFFSYSDSYKVGLIPTYKMNQKYKRYYSESIVSVFSYQIPIIEDSWLSYYVVNKAQMKNQYAVNLARTQSAMEQQLLSGSVDTGVAGMTSFYKGAQTGGLAGGLASGFVSAVGKGAQEVAKRLNLVTDYTYNRQIIALTQSAKKSDMGAKPDTVRLSGSDNLYELLQKDMGFHYNEYRIDKVSYDSISKYLERFGYLVNIFDSLNIYDRIGLNFIKLSSFDFVEDNFVLSTEQMSAVSEIFANGVTLLHDKNFLHNLGEVINNVSYHNYEYALKTN